MTVLLGAIADDFTGATDLANTLVKAGMPTVQLIGVPDAEPELGDARAVVVALKSRTAPASEAVEDSLHALRWLLDRGAEQILFKYCSTFDSTSKGNIGPVADALMAEMGERFSIICPAFPANSRSIYMGNLFVGNELLAESSMKDHPLTPMRDSSLVRLMSAQSRHNVGLIEHQTVAKGSTHVLDEFRRLAQEGNGYAVLDAIDDNDLMVLGEALADMRFLTGGSGIAMGLPENFRKAGKLKDFQIPAVSSNGGRVLIVAGSCSVATLGQIRHAEAAGWPTIEIKAERCLDQSDYCQELCDWAIGQSSNLPVLVYASSSPVNVKAVQNTYGAETAGRMIEDVLSGVAKTLVGEGFNSLIVAGGETSGAVVSRLGIKQLEICNEIQPGVPWTRTGQDGELVLALKSGNFGTPDFFEVATDMIQ